MTPEYAFYTHVSDQHGPYSVKVISAATHEAPYVLDGLLHHGCSASTTLSGADNHLGRF
jgi:TnpA family transposase